MGVLYKRNGSKSLRARLDEWSDPLKRINSPKKVRRRRVPDEIPLVEMKRVVTRFGIVEMPVGVNQEDLAADDFIADPRLRLVADRDLTGPERSLVTRMSVEGLPKLNPRPALSDAQICFLQIVAELESGGVPFGWDDAYAHFASVRGISKETMRSFNGKRAGDSLQRRGLLVEGPRLTRAGRVRVREHDEALRLKRQLGIKEYPLVKIERHDRYRAYDEIYVKKDGKVRCFFRHECRGFRCPSIVYVCER